jgi:hypothetical protein
VLYSAASYGGYGDKSYGGSKVVSFKLSPRVCANYYSDKGGYSSQGYRVMIQYDPNIVSHEDVNFVAKCDAYSEPPRELYMQYTTIDAKPIYLTVRKFILKFFKMFLLSQNASLTPGYVSPAGQDQERQL